ncbi:MAG: hypothetical protein K0R57_103 [Paenibacillaceae bacterium]|jgi:AraC-like DNA-binding protein|nr:hypothetical protein [Paenibacillaceae bacterium]
MKKPFLRKLVAAYIMIALLYTFIAGGVHLYNGYRTMEIQLQDQRAAFVKQTQTRLDMKLSVAFNYVNQLRGKQDVLDYARAPTSNNYALTQVFKELSGNMNAFTNLEYQIDLVALHDSTVITPFSTMSRPHYYEYMGLGPEVVNRLEEYESNGQWSKLHLVTSASAAKLGDRIIFARKETLNGGAEAMFFISFHKETFLPSLKGSGGEDFGILFSDEIWVDGANAEDRPAAAAILSAAGGDSAGDSAGDTGYSVFKLDGKVVHVANAAVLNNLKYVYFTPETSFGASLWTLLRDSSLVYTVMALMGIALAFFLANRMYRPVRNIIGIFKDYNDLKETDEFSFIQETASTIREINLGLRETISNNRLSLKSKFLRDLLLGMLNNEQAMQGVDRYGLEWVRRETTVILFDFPDEQGWEDEYSSEAILHIRSQTMGIIREHIMEFGRCESVELDYSRYAILIPEVRVHRIKQMTVGAVASVEASFGIHITAAVGPPALQFLQLKEACQLAGRLLEQRLTLHKQSVLTYEDLAPLQNLNYYYPLDMERELIIRVLQGKGDQAEELLDHILDENMGKGKLGEGTLQFFLYACITTINRILQHMSKTEADIFPEGRSVYDTLWSSRSEEQIRERLHLLLRRLIQVTEEKNQELDHSIVHQMIDYMHTHYHQDIALADLAKHFNLSSNYISYLIKEHIGDNFKDYLNEYRVKQAKRIINDNPSVKVNDLAGMVGCNNANTFIRIFKKYEGLSPGQYMKQQTNGHA